LNFLPEKSFMSDVSTTIKKHGFFGERGSDFQSQKCQETLVLKDYPFEQGANDFNTFTVKHQKTLENFRKLRNSAVQNPAPFIGCWVFCWVLAGKLAGLFVGFSLGNLPGCLRGCFAINVGPFS
jgi:hypothetical protein